MMKDGSVTRWIQALRAGEKDAAGQIWERFFDRMKQIARPRSQPHVTRGAYDEEDVALSAFASFCRALHAGNYPELNGRTELWQVLATFTYRKARERGLAARAQKRGGSCLTRGDAPFSLDELTDEGLSPDMLAIMNEECHFLFSILNDPELETVAVWKLEGFTNTEIAERLGYTRRTVQRMLALIRRIWKKALD